MANHSEEFREHRKRFEKEHEEVFQFRRNTKSVLSVDFIMSEFKGNINSAIKCLEI